MVSETVDLAAWHSNLHVVPVVCWAVLGSAPPSLSLSLSVPESVWSAQCFYDERVLQALQAAPSYGSYEALLLHWTVKHGYGDDVLPCSSCRGFGADKVGEVH